MYEKLEQLPLSDLRDKWQSLWGVKPHRWIGRTMLERSIVFKMTNNLTPEQQSRFGALVRQYKRSPKFFGDRCNALKVGTKLVRNWKGKQHVVLVKVDGFEYNEIHYSSLSKIANEITGSKWNGYLFFGLK